MSEQTPTQTPPAQASQPSITFEVFEMYYKQNPDLDNAEYYAAFPAVNQGTVRSWKSRAAKASEPPKPPEQSTPPERPPAPESEQIKSMITAINNIPGQHLDEAILQGMDEHSKLVFLQNWIQHVEKTKGTGNRPILPSSTGTNTPEFWIDQFLTIDPQKKEIELMVPASKYIKYVNEQKIKQNKKKILW